jgi:RNA polymerase sigma factor (sigma-70 family)
MAERCTSPVLQFIRKIAASREAGELTDGLLLERFAKLRDEAAFDAILSRHGSLVFGVCRRLLHHEQDAEDAFQATFLVFARQARSITKRESVASWLYGVAYRVACKVRRRTARQQAREAELLDVSASEQTPEVLRRDLAAVLDEEINRLPEKYRVPFVLCYLEGKTNEQAARLLGCPLGTVSSQLCRARARLRTRLTRRGAALSVGMTGVLAEGVNATIVPPGLCESTARAALFVATGRSAAGGMISAEVLGLMKGVLNTMAATKLGLAALALLTMGVIIAGTGSIAYYLVAAEPTARQPAAPSRDATPKEDKSSDALVDFKKVYDLKRDEDLKRVAPPFPDSRTEYIRSLYHFPPKTARLPEYGSMYLRWHEQDGFKWLGATSPRGTLKHLPQHLASIYPQEIEGEQALLDKDVEGDFIVRKGLSAEKFVERLEQILRHECNLAVKLTLREEERKVYVARGKYQYTPLAGRSEHHLELYAKELNDTGRGGGGTDEFPTMLQAAGAWIGRRIINEVQEAPKQQVSWHYNHRELFTAQQHQEDTDAAAVLGHLAEQTGLTFNEETRKVRVLFVEE